MKKRRVIDLAQEISPEMNIWAGYPKPTLLTWIPRNAYGFVAEVWLAPLHLGTHLDCGIHFCENGMTAEQYPIEKFVANGVLLDFTHKKPRESITAEDIKEAERKLGIGIKEGDAVLIYTGWMDKHLKPETPLDTSYVGLSRDAGEYLLSKKVAVVGIDSTNVDNAESEDKASPENPPPCHKLLLCSEINLIENLVNLRQIRKKYGFTFIYQPLKVKGASGTPIRPIAIEEEE